MTEKSVFRPTIPSEGLLKRMDSESESIIVIQVPYLPTPEEELHNKEILAKLKEWESKGKK